MTGFEPATSCSQNRSATKLRYIPISLLNLHFTSLSEVLQPPAPASLGVLRPSCLATGEKNAAGRSHSAANPCHNCGVALLHGAALNGW